MSKKTPTRPQRGPGVWMIDPNTVDAFGKPKDGLVFVTTGHDAPLSELQVKAGSA
jgi:ribulose 1,5-bisphosphate synthetase/thiazole synthase